jgi:hypothetical protein
MEDSDSNPENKFGGKLVSKFLPRFLKTSQNSYTQIEISKKITL